MSDFLYITTVFSKYEYIHVISKSRRMILQRYLSLHRPTAHDVCGASRRSFIASSWRYGWPNSACSMGERACMLVRVSGPRVFMPCREAAATQLLGRLVCQGRQARWMHESSLQSRRRAGPKSWPCLAQKTWRSNSRIHPYAG